MDKISVYLTSGQGNGQIMSSEEEIRAVYEEDINRMSSLVESKFGKKAFLVGMSGYHIENVHNSIKANNIKCNDSQGVKRASSKRVK